MNCTICNKLNPIWSWTDTHGIAQCMTCGTPYRLYHYEGNADDIKRVEKPPTLCVDQKYIPVLQEYWKQIKRTIPGHHSFPGGQELANDEDIEIFNKWMTKNAEKFLVI
jgi:hypothetical protein